jgi:hypothetical protein
MANGRYSEWCNFMTTIRDAVKFANAKGAVIELKFDQEVRLLNDKLRKEQARVQNIHSRLTVAESELRQIRRLLEQQRK